jgi:hypothetical protein
MFHFGTNELFYFSDWDGHATAIFSLTGYDYFVFLPVKKFMQDSGYTIIELHAMEGLIK